jgi:MarR family transcriptional regulator, 2-MHQ and catechol-resistance regulon repressor
MESGTHIRLILGKASKAVEKVDRASIAETGLNLSDFTILEALLHKGPLPVNSIGKKVLLTSGSMTAAVNRLGTKGFVERTQDPSDRRRFYVHLTKSGRKFIKRAYGAHQKNLERIAEGLTAKERADLVRLLKKIGSHAENVNLT